MEIRKITESITGVGVRDTQIDLFEGIYDVPEGMLYNSYVIKDNLTAVVDSVAENFGAEWLENISKVTDKVDYLIVQHVEPDHSANVKLLTDKFPDAKVVASAKAFDFIKQFYGADYSDRRVVVKEGDTLDLGTHKLRFVGAPMVHWPEVIMTYDTTDKAFFSADAFGKFGELEGDEWACEARRYYFGIVGKYGAQVQELLKKASALDIKMILPLHGPILTENLGYYLGLYNTWSSYGVESEGVAIAYTSVYGNTKRTVEKLARLLEAKGCPKVAVSDLARDDMAEAVEDAFRYGKIILATTTYNNDIFPFMREFIADLTERNFQKKTIGIIENGTWAPNAAKKIKAAFENSKDITFTQTTVTLKSALNEASEAQLERLADEILA